MRVRFPLIVALLWAAACAGPVLADRAAERERFARPPDDARPLVRWWWFGPAVTASEVRREIAAMRAGGFGGFELQNTYPLATGTTPPGVANLPFLSPGHRAMIGLAAAEARSQHLRMDLTLGSGWPYGGAATPITESAGALRIARGNATPREGEQVLATVGDATFLAGRTRMKVKRPALDAEGYVVDHLDRSAVRRFLDAVATPLVDACGDARPHALFCDSLECYGEDWTPDLPAEFQRRRGYDLRPLLPALATDAEVRHDWGQTLTELFDDAFARPVADFAHAHGSRFRAQAYGVPAAGASSYLAVDLPEGEGHQWHGYRATRYASSAAHVMGIPISSSEAFTWLHPPVFRATPLDVKAEANQHFLQGVNQLVCHGWPYSPPEAGEPGWSFYVATVFNDHNPWWPAMPELTRYLTRCSDLLRQGRPADDVAVYLPNDDAWAQFTPGHASLTDALGERLGHDLVGRILDGGYNLDFFDDRLLAARGSVDGDALAFGDLRYRVVVLPGVERIPPATLATLERFVHGGGTLIATRSVPSRAPGHLATAQDQQAVTDGVARLFRGDHPRARLVRDERDLPAALAERLAPDVTLDPPNAAVGFVHRVTPTADIYFLANTSNQPVHARVRFRAAHRSAERWDPTTGTALALSMVGDRYPLDLEPYDAAFVLLDDADLPAPHAVVPAATANVDWSDGWSLRFPGEAAPVALGRVHPWTDDPARRSFSGVAVYGRHVSVDPALLSEGRRLTLDFGQGTPRPARPVERGNPGFAAELDPPVAEAAVVYVNDRRAGAVWCPPYALDVSGLLHAGDNALRVEVANTAVNGLAGGRFPNYDVAGLTAKFGKRFDPAKAEAFRPATSGLAGPIVLRVAR